ncbi:hypothetical protein [Parabacteroides distasonis]|uniref:hypothetical protein n=1 Tax=Parabacteroides distasonis TaxID=823 RepID=UPI0032BF2953
MALDLINDIPHIINLVLRFLYTIIKFFRIFPNILYGIVLCLQLIGNGLLAHGINLAITTGIEYAYVTLMLQPLSFRTVPVPT